MASDFFERKKKKKQHRNHSFLCTKWDHAEKSIEKYYLPSEKACKIHVVYLLGRNKLPSCRSLRRLLFLFNVNEMRWEQGEIKFATFYWCLLEFRSQPSKAFFFHFLAVFSFEISGEARNCSEWILGKFSQIIYLRMERAFSSLQSGLLVFLTVFYLKELRMR